jgi:hypothetical protein
LPSRVSFRLGRELFYHITSRLSIPFLKKIKKIKML